MLKDEMNKEKRLAKRVDKAKHVARAGIITKLKEKAGQVWAVPSDNGKLYYVYRDKRNYFSCWLQLPEGEEPCKGFAFGYICWHIIAVVVDEMEAKGFSIGFWENSKEALRQKKRLFILKGRNNSRLFVTYGRRR